MPASACLPMPGIRFLEIEELARCDMPLWLAWRIGNDSPALGNLVTLAGEAFTPKKTGPTV